MFTRFGYTYFTAPMCKLVQHLKGTGSRLSACSFVKMLVSCRDLVYRLYNQYDHVMYKCCQGTNLHTPLAVIYT